MSPAPDGLARAVDSHRAFDSESDAETTFVSTTTAFDGVVDAESTDDGVSFTVTVIVPMLSTVTDDDLAPIVEDGWYETFERRVTDVGAIFRIERELTPAVSHDGSEAVVTATLTDRNVERGVDDAAALIDFVEGTYVQGIIPGYTYTDPVAGLLEQARAAGGSN
ncbi:DUF5813 family protein [Halonotius roseus]|uniref:Uncharacterized protein n=1 Tax=Halonotius roseus TaxID=2511997 RepID=A0A544QNM8_9EURY|nr:DUF5813 family protein [Halonotius roseus]TQQ80518.1 hypothetical protein EWF95_08495 [Halonotius roseus]